MKKNIVSEKSKVFAIRIIKLYQYLVREKREYVLSRQILKSGTSIGANLREAEFAQSKKDFYCKNQHCSKRSRRKRILARNSLLYRIYLKTRIRKYIRSVQ